MCRIGVWGHELLPDRSGHCWQACSELGERDPAICDRQPCLSYDSAPQPKHDQCLPVSLEADKIGLQLLKVNFADRGATQQVMAILGHSYAFLYTG